MYSLVVLLVCLGLTAAAPQFNTNAQYTTPVPIISQTQDGPNPDGSYQWSYQTGNGIAAQEQGYLKNPGTQDEGQAAQGSFTYTGPDGQTYTINYIADDGGFQAQGAHLPTPPPIPAAIQRALDFLATQPQQDYDERGFPIGQSRPNFG